MRKLIYILFLVGSLLLVSCTKPTTLTITGYKIEKINTLKATFKVAHSGAPVEVKIRLMQNDITSSREFEQVFIVSYNTEIVFNFSQPLKKSYYLVATWRDDNGGNFKTFKGK